MVHRVTCSTCSFGVSRDGRTCGPQPTLPSTSMSGSFHALGPPVVTNTGATGLQVGSATLGGLFLDHNRGDVTVCWGTTDGGTGYCIEYTGSAIAKSILADWETWRDRFVKVYPTEYRRALKDIAAQQLKEVV